MSHSRLGSCRAEVAECRLDDQLYLLAALAPDLKADVQYRTDCRCIPLHYGRGDLLLANDHSYLRPLIVFLAEYRSSSCFCNLTRHEWHKVAQLLVSESMILKRSRRVAKEQA